MIPLAEPNLSGKEKEYVTDAIASGWVSGGGPYVERFEEMVAKACGRKWAVVTITGTAALHVALSAQVKKLRHFDEQVDARMHSMHFIAGANALEYLEISPWFSDISDDWTPDYNWVGNIIDSAPCVGLKGNTYTTAILSFNGNKTITTGQGGAIIGDDRDSEKQIRHLVNIAKTEGYNFDEIGFNYRMPNVNAAIGCAQMERLEEFRERKSEIMKCYAEASVDLVSSMWMAIAKFDDRKTIISFLRSSGIDVRPFWTPLHLQEPYKDCSRDPLPNTEAIWDKLVCLPCSTNLTEADQDKVIKCVSSL